jgi:hypothetical protein
MTATKIFYRVTDQPVEFRPAVVVTIEGARVDSAAAVNDRAVVVWTQEDRPELDEWGDLAGVQFEMELQDPPAPIEQLRMFTDYR